MLSFIPVRPRPDGARPARGGARPGRCRQRHGAAKCRRSPACPRSGGRGRYASPGSLIAKINAALDEMKKDGSYDKLLEKYDLK